MFLSFLKKLFSGGEDRLQQLLDAKAIILDVRSAAEFKSGHVKGAVHIPLDQVGREIQRIRKYGVPVITCCASGRRSGMAADMLRKAGIEAVNGGPWTRVKQAVQAHQPTAG